MASGFYQGLLGSAISRNVDSNVTQIFLYYTESNANLGNISSNRTDLVDFENESRVELGSKLYRYDLISDNLVNPKLLLSLSSSPGP